MASLEPTANNYCSLAFNGLYYQNNSASPCCAMGTEKMSPNEYIASKETLKLHQDFDNGLKPNRCDNCWTKEKFGYKSIRLSFLHRKKQLNKITHLELRESNLCNFACRMCNSNDSIVIEREIKANPDLQQFFVAHNEKPTTNENWNQILELTKNVESINLTGGEPMLMKRYQLLLDHLISTGKENISLNVYTNGSVYNSLFLNKLLKFPNAKLIFSIDAVGKIAEYQRYGGKWENIRKVIVRCTELPINIRIHSTISAYSILGVSELADFFVELSNNNSGNLHPFTAHVVRNPNILEIVNLNVDLRLIAIRKIDLAVAKLANDELFVTYIKELLSVKKQLMARKDCNFSAFTNMTKLLDKIRNQSFEDTFGYKI